MLYQYKPTTHDRAPHLHGLPYGLRLRTIGRPNAQGLIRCRDLSGRLLGLIPFNQLERL